MELKNMLKKFFLFYIILIYSKNIKNACLKEAYGKVNEENLINVLKGSIPVGIFYVCLCGFQALLSNVLKAPIIVESKSNANNDDLKVFYCLFNSCIEKIKKESEVSKGSSINRDSSEYEINEEEAKIIKNIMAKISIYDLVCLRNNLSNKEYLKQFFKIKFFEFIIGMVVLSIVSACCGKKEKIFNKKVVLLLFAGEAVLMVIDIALLLKKLAAVEKIKKELENGSKTMEGFLRELSPIFKSNIWNYGAKAKMVYELCLLGMG